MSSVCGMINFNNDVVEDRKKEAMIKSFKNNSDKTNIWCKQNAFLGCHMLHITAESINEILPFYDEETGYAITADAIIDNRTELLMSFEYSKEDWHLIPDSLIILCAYKKWGEECVKHLNGDFAFVIYDYRNNKLFCARDHTGKRPFYYYYSKDAFAFSSNMMALLRVMENRCKLNDRWIADFLSFEGPFHEVDCAQTVFKDVMQLMPANTISITSDSFQIKQYWYACNTPELKLSSNEAYAEGLKHLLSEVTKDKSRTHKDVGIRLSGGIDSGTIACIASEQLKSEDKVLKAYSSVPCSKYKNYLNSAWDPDESKYIEAIKKQYDNIIHTYWSSEGKNSITDIEKYIGYLEHPYKIVENFFWLNELTSLAAKNNCGVLLNGTYGNVSFSFGDIITHLVTLHNKGKYIKLINELCYFSSVIDTSTYRVIKWVMKLILPEKVLKLLNKKQDFNEMVPVNPELAAMCRVDERLKYYEIGKYATRKRDIYEYRKVMSSQRVLSQVSGTDAKMSQEYGLIIRDPSADKRIIEYCFSMPYDQYVRKGNTRDLARRATEGILPNEIRMNHKSRGFQSADWIQRVAPNMEEIKNELSSLLEEDAFKYYIDSTKVKQTLEHLKVNDRSVANSELRMLIVCLIFGKFLRFYEKI